jgi:hypothetical protein
MDDLLMMHQDKDKLELESLQICAYLSSLGWTLSLAKCELTPSMEIQFLGWMWSSGTLTLRMTREMQASILRSLHEWDNRVMKHVTVSSKALGAIIGSLNFLRAQIPRASLYLRNLQSALTVMVASVGWTGSSTVSNKVSSEIHFWLRNVQYNTPYSFALRVSRARLTTDASEGGWAGHLEIGVLLWHTFGFYFPADGLTSSNQRETAAVLRSLLFFAPYLQYYQIHGLTIRSDNLVTVFNLQRQGAGPALLYLTREIFSILTTHDIRLHVTHIRGIENVLVDALSRLEITGDYQLKQEVYDNCVTLLGVTPTIDLFAHCQNSKCSRFVSLPGVRAAGATALDAFDVADWSRELAYIFPPVQIIDRVLMRLLMDEATAVLVVPKWTSQPWWGLLRPMIRTVVELGNSDLVLNPGPGMTESESEKKLPPGLFLMALVSGKKE